MSDSYIQVQITQQEGYFLEVRDEEGHTYYVDTRPEVGGTNRAMRPLLVMLGSLGACAGMDAIGILGKMREPLQKLHITVRAEKIPNSKPTQVKAIHLHFHLECNLTPERVARAIDLAVNKYCSVGKLIRHDVPITYTWEIWSNQTRQHTGEGKRITDIPTTTTTSS